MRYKPGEMLPMRSVRFLTRGCCLFTGAIASEASVAERQGRISDGEDGGSLEQKQTRGLFLMDSSVPTWLRNEKRIAVTTSSSMIVGRSSA